jgi:predicted esterase
MPPRIKRYSCLLVLFLLLGCGRDAPQADGRAGPGTISGEVKVEKPETALIYIAIGKSLDRLTTGRVDKLLVMAQAGSFHFDDVQAGTYRLGAFVDLNGNRIPETTLEPYVVLESELSVSPGEHINNVRLEGFFNKRDPSFKTESRVREYETMVSTAAPAVEYLYRKMEAEGDVTGFDVIPTLRAMLYEGEMTWQVAGNRADWEHIRALLEPIPDLAATALNGENPLYSLRGFFLRAYLSEVDRTIRSYAVYIPQAYDGSSSLPLVIALHGAGGNHWTGMKMVAGCSDFLIGPKKANRHFFPRKMPNDFIIACPGGHGYGGPGYRGPAEYDVLRVIREMCRDYNIDPERIYLTGASKGGSGTWELGLTHPHLFAAIAPVCGGTGLARTIAQNAVGLDIFVFHGLRDEIIPVNESRLMVELLKRKRIPFKYFENPEWGHDASYLAYRDGAIFELFRKQRKEY